MKYRRLGRTGLAVSEISLGTVEIGMPYGIAAQGESLHPDEAQASKLLNYALDHGINFIDTARAYGESEAFIGRALKGRRQEFVLASKVTVPSEKDVRHHVLSSIETSLRLLETDVIDIMMIHSAPVETIANGEVLAILQGVKQSGEIRWIGSSVYGEDAARAAIADGGYDCLQIAYSVLDRRPEANVVPEAEKAGVGLVARSVLLKGSLTNRVDLLSDELLELKTAVRRMREIAAREGMSLPELAYRYVLSHSTPQTALVGTATTHELAEAIAFAGGGISDDLLAEIRSLPMPDARYLNPANWPPLP